MFALVTAWLLSATTATAQIDSPLYDQERYDRITLKDEDATVIKIQPPDSPGGVPPAESRRQGPLNVRILGDAQPYEIDWSQIAEYKTFHQLVLEELETKIAAGRFDESYDYFRYLQSNAAGLPGVDEAFDRYLYAEAKALHARGENELALSLLNDLYDRAPGYEKLGEGLGAVTATLIAERAAAEDYAGARGLLRLTKDPANPAMVAAREMLTRRATVRLDEARRLFEAGRMADADDAVFAALTIWPELPGAEALVQSIHTAYPRVIVGVVPAATVGARRLNERGAAREARLLQRSLAEFAGFGPGGGEYRQPLGAWETQDLGRRLVLKVAEGVRWSSGEGELTGYDVARRLVELADPTSSLHREPWASLFAGAAVRDIYTVEVDLTRQHVQPIALLEAPVAPFDAPTGVEAPSLGPYRLASRSNESPADDLTRYVANPHYFAARQDQPVEVLERVFLDGAEAAAALTAGEISAIDQVNPWHVASLAANDRLVVERYGAPTIHCLIPGARNPLLARRTFRRALAYGMDRGRILERDVLHGPAGEANRVVSGPFPAGTTLDDPLGYAYNESVEIRPYEPRLAITLISAAMSELSPARQEPGDESSAEQEARPAPKLVLAHGASDVPRAACQRIERYWRAIGLDVERIEIPPGESIPWDDVDLAYVELLVQHPLIDAGRLLGDDGALTGASPYLRLALGQLTTSTDFATTRAKLREIHRIVHDEAALIPLWQTVDYFAYRRDMPGVGERPSTLYQNIENWRPAPRVPPSTP